MLAFLIGTTILNLFLGYALAVYLMRASQAAEYHPLPRPADRKGTAEATPTLFADASLSTPATEAGAASPLTTSAAAPAESTAASAATNEQAADDSAAATAAAGESAEESVARAGGSEELDQQLLAGIADFRSQLAKLRSETGQPEEGKRRPVARK